MVFVGGTRIGGASTCDCCGEWVGSGGGRSGGFAGGVDDDEGSQGLRIGGRASAGEHRLG